MRFSFAAALALAAQASAHFIMQYPYAVGFNDDTEGTAPCGGVSINQNNVSDFAVGGDAISMQVFHPQVNWLFRATLDLTAQSGFEQMFPIVQQVGQGYFCEPNVMAPSNWTGKRGLIQVVANGPDGILYECSIVNFVNGTGTAPICKNATGLTASYVADSTLAAIVSGQTPTSSSSASSTSSTKKSGSSGPLMAASTVGVLAWVSTLVLGTVGFALM